MAEYTLTIPTEIEVGESVVFNDTIVPGGCSIKKRNGTIRLRGGSCCRPTRYRIYFHGVLTGVAGTMQMAIYQDGEILPETLMSVVAAAATNELSVDAMTEVLVDCQSSSISVRLTEGDGVTINTGAIIIDKEVA